MYIYMWKYRYVYMGNNILYEQEFMNLGDGKSLRRREGKECIDAVLMYIILKKYI